MSNLAHIPNVEERCRTNKTSLGFAVSHITWNIVKEHTCALALLMKEAHVTVAPFLFVVGELCEVTVPLSHLLKL